MRVRPLARAATTLNLRSQAGGVALKPPSLGHGCVTTVRKGNAPPHRDVEAHPRRWWLHQALDASDVVNDLLDGFLATVR